MVSFVKTNSLFAMSAQFHLILVICSCPLQYPFGTSHTLLFILNWVMSKDIGHKYRYNANFGLQLLMKSMSTNY